MAAAGCAASGGGAVKQGYFFVGGRYVDTKAGPIMERQMYVEYRVPAAQSQRWPIVMIHGAAQTGTNFTGTPDGRKGWAEWFVEQGYAVYVVDQPARGRSAWNESVAPVIRFPAHQLEQRFTATANFNLWPQAALHTQWPGEGPKKGLRGDPVFDQFYASQVQYVGASTVNETNNRSALAALLDRIGPAIILTHSQSGPFGWVVADERPALVKAIVAAEPTGPPFRNAVFNTTAARPWGVTSTPMKYDPPVADPKELRTQEQAAPDGPNLVRCILQAEPARRLASLQRIPVMIFAAEASYHATYDHCTAKFLNQAGVKTDFVRLEDEGIRGNGHMVMIEKNNLEIAALIHRWLAANVK
ncbi:MAG: alpha/beta fold hydrolase [Burkholderiales bacterium]|nr:alpha/beta fold hydrolase [Burkholderiales bacterium]